MKLKLAGHVTDMTSGSPIKHLLQFSLPLLIGNIFQQLYNMVDSLVVGNYVGKNALAAVGACGSLNFLFFSIGGGMAAGIGVIVSQYFGGGDDKNVKKTIANSVYILSVTAVITSTIAIIFAPQILKLMDTPPGIIKDSITYLRITSAGMLGVTAYNGAASILRSLGDSKTPLYLLILSSIINVVLDLVFVLAFDMSVLGVALATIISQFVCAVASIIYACTKIPHFKIEKSLRAFDSDIVAKSVKIGVPLALQNSLIAISCVILQNVVNGFGETVVAAFTVTGRIEQLIQQPYSSLAMAVTTYTGQNMGAMKVDRVKKGFKCAVVMALFFSLLMLTVTYLFSSDIIHAFVKEDDVISIGARALKITSLCYFPLGMIYVPRALMNGARDAKFAMINGLTEVACRIVFSHALTSIAFIGYWGIWITSGATWLVTAIVCLARYFSEVWIKQPIGIKEADGKNIGIDEGKGIYPENIKIQINETK